MKRMVGMSLAFGLCLWGTAEAQQKDFGAGFQKFRGMGMPDVSGATYVKLDVYGGYRSPDMGASMLYDLRLAGNAWMLSENKQAKSVFVVNYCRMTEVYDQKATEKEFQARIKEAMKSGDKEAMARLNRERYQGRTSGRWRPVDLKRDVDKTLAYLKKDDDSGRRRLESVLENGGSGSLFLMAAQIYSRGMTNEANEIVSLLFEKSKDPKQVVRQALDTLGQSQYDEVCDRFFEGTNDWAAFAADLEAVSARFGASWSVGPGVKRLIDQVRVRAGQSRPQPLSAAGLSDEDQALALELAAVTNAQEVVDSSGYGGLWILEPRARKAAAKKQPEPSRGVLDRIKARGMTSIPLLMALLKDDYLLRLDSQRLGGYGGGYMMQFHYSSMEAEMMEREMGEGGLAEQMFRSLRRPMTRGDFAARMLQNLPIRGEEQSFDSNDPEELLAAVETWYEANKGKSSMELAREYLAKGDSSQKNLAMTYLMEAGGEEDFKAIEDMILEAGEPWENMSMAQTYMAKRGAKAGAFAEKFTARMKEMAAENEGAAEMMGEYGGEWMNQMMAAFGGTMTTQSVSQILDGIAQGDKNWQNPWQPLQAALAKESPTNAVTLLLEAALKAKKPEVAMQLVGMTAQIRYMKQMAAGLEGATEEEMEALAEEMNKPPEPMDITPHVELWRKVLADTRTIDSGSMGWWGQGTVGDAALMTLEGLYGSPEEMYGGGNARGLNWQDPRMKKAMRERAEARLALKPESELPKFPSADNVSSERRAAMQKELAELADDAAIRAWIDRLTLDESVALGEMSEEDDETGRKLASLARRVSKVTATLKSAEEAAKWTAQEGQPLSKALIESLVTLARELTEKGSFVTVYMMPQAGFGGTQLMITEKSLAEYTNSVESAFMPIEYLARQSARLTVSLSSEGANAYMTVRVGGDVKAGGPRTVVAATNEAPATDVLEAAAEEMEMELEEADFGSGNEEEFRQALDDMFKPGEDAPPLQQFYIQGVPKFKAPKSGGRRGMPFGMPMFEGSMVIE